MSRALFSRLLAATLACAVFAAGDGLAASPCLAAEAAGTVRTAGSLGALGGVEAVALPNPWRLAGGRLSDQPVAPEDLDAAEPAPRPALLNPGLAAAAGPLASFLGLNLTGLAVLGLASAQAEPAGSPLVNGVAIGGAALSALSLGAGHAYAGEPMRGLWFGLGEAALFAGTLGVLAASGKQGEGAGYLWAFGLMPVVVPAFLGLNAWAAADAYGAARAENERRLREAGLRD